MITEDYVSFEIAKLLKEKKFGWKCNTVYLEFEDGRVELRYEDKAFYQEQTKRRYCVPALLAPSLYNAMKWLREVHNIHIGTKPYNLQHPKPGKWYKTQTEATIYNTKDGSLLGDMLIKEKFCEDTYEEAVEAALKYTLENLI